MTFEAILPPLRTPGERIGRTIWRNKGLAIVIATAVVSLVFYLATSLDLAVSDHFYEGDARFPLARDPAVQFVRSVGHAATVVVIGLAILGLAGPLALHMRRVGLWPHQAAYVLTVYAVGPGLIVNGILKEHIGRARPRELTQFGGEQAFSPLWAAADGCSGNCSFASGEASAAAALMCLIPLIPKADRLAGGLAITAIAAIISVNRVAVGAHFLSDVLIAWGIVLFVAIALKPLFFGHRATAINAAIAGEADRHARIRAWIARRVREALAPPAVRLAYADAAMPVSGVAPGIAADAAAADADDRRPAAPVPPPRAAFTTLSVVVPARNEASNLAVLVPEIGATLAGRSHEIVVVDDGSHDDTAATLARLRAEGSNVRHLRHARSAGQSRAVRTGMLGARGDLIVTIDGDGQNDPAFIPDLVDRLEAGGPRVGLAAGQRTGRTDGRLKTLSSRFANAVRTAVLKDSTRDTGCGLKAIPTALFRTLPYFDGWHRYLPALVLREGYGIAHVDVRDRERRFGRSNYGIVDRGLRGILDLYGVWWLILRASEVPAVTEIAAEEPA